MRINKRMANKLKKFNLSGLGRDMGISCRATVSAWITRQSIPDERVEELEQLTGLTIK